MINNGFLVKGDHFKFSDRRSYILDGWLAPDGSIEATLNRKPLETEIKCHAGIISEKEHGYPCSVRIKMPSLLEDGDTLKVFGVVGGKKSLCFYQKGRQMQEKRSDIRYFLDEVYISRQENLCRIQGWCIGEEKVQIALADAARTRMECTVEWMNRRDVTALYEDIDPDPHCGFMIELRPIPKRCVYLLMKAGEARKSIRIATDALSMKRQAAEKTIQKGMAYFRYNGLIPMVGKVGNKILNRNNTAISYGRWIKRHLPSAKTLAEQKKEVFAVSPKISIVVPLYRTPEKYLKELIESVRAQTYGNWELCLSDGSGADSPLAGTLARWVAKEPRIRVIHNPAQLHIAENTNEAIKAASGDYIAFADHDDLLTPDALYEFVKMINKHPDLELVYSDEDKVAPGNRYIQPHMKPDFNPDLLCTVNYISHFTMVKRTLIDRVGMLRPEYDGAQDYDFILRCAEVAEGIYHVPRILYHWRFFEGSTAENPESKRYAFEAGQRAIQAHYGRMNIPAEVSFGEYLGLYRTRYLWEEKPLISIMIPNKDHIEDLKVCISAIEEKSTYRNYEFIIIENNSADPETFRYYKELEASNDKVKVVYYEGEFNYSAINNFGARYAQGEYLLLLNNDTEIINEDCLEELLGYCMRPDVGAVGARLFYEDDTIQHAGVIVGFGGIAGHAFIQQKRGFSGYCHRIICAQDYSAVTAACMMVKKSVFDRVGGLSEELKVAFNDVDFCMKIRQAGYLIVYNPYAQLYHYESKSRGMEDTPEKVYRFNQEIKTFEEKWPEILRDGDPYYSPNLTLDSQDFSLRRI